MQSEETRNGSASAPSAALIKTIAASSLIHGLTTSCGRCTSKETGRRKTIDLTNQKFGRLLVIARAGSSLRGRALWQCRCECDGSIVIVLGKELRNGHTVSCGCWKAERMGDFARTHGMGLTREYKSWKAAKQRCTNPKDTNYPLYGGRGIQMCEEWMDSFPDFYAHIGPRPQGHSLDRIDVNGNYEPGNVRWATAKDQANNRRR